MASGSKKVIYAALIGNFLIAITKFFAAFLTGSSAMLSEGIHSLVDTGNQVLLLYGLRRAKLPPDERFPFGHGKEVYFWSFVVAILIFAVGSGVSLYEGIQHMLHPSHMDDPTINYIVLVLAMIFEGFAWYFAWKEFKKVKGKRDYFTAVQRSKDPTIFVVLFEDSAAMLGLIVAFLGVWLAQVTHNPIFDGLASVIIGLILGGTAIWLAIETKSLLIGESADPKVIRGIREMTQAYPEILHINEVLTMHMGPEFILVNLSVNFADNHRPDDIERVIAQLDKQIKQSFPRVKRVFVEAERQKISPAP